MEHLTIEQAIEHLHEMAERLKEMQEKHPDVEYRGVRLCLNGGTLERAKWEGDGVYYTSLGENGRELGIDIFFTTEDEEDRED